MSEGTRAGRLRTLNPLSIGGVLVAFILLGALYAVTTPLFETPDELWHYPMVKTLADGNGLPVLDPANPGPWQQEAGQPPLYYALMALATRWIDTSDMEEVRWLNPHVDNGVVTEDGNNNLVIHTWREAWPWHGTALAIRLIRLLSVGLGAGTVYAAYRLALEIEPERRGLAVAVAGLIAFTPMFVFISASVNNDSLVTFCSTLTLWVLLRWRRQAPSRIGWGHVGLGFLLGAGALSKQSALGLLPLTALALLSTHIQTLIAEPWSAPGQLARRVAGILPAVLFHAVVIFGLALAVSGWWYWRNYQLYGDWLGWNRFIAIMGPRAQPASLEQLWGERDGFIQSLWGLFGHLSVPMPDWAYHVLNSGAGLAVIGLGLGLARAIAGRRITVQNILIWGLPLIWLSLVVAGLVRWTSLTLASQGRLIFPAIAVLSLLIVYGLAAVWPRLPAVLIAFMAGLSAFVPVFVIGPHYAAPPELTPEATVMIPHRVEANFGGEMQLLGYALETEVVQPGNSVRLTLYWQSLIAMDRNWSVFVHVVDDQGIIVGQRDRYPGRGALATTLLRLGQTFADTYVVPLPPGTYAPAEAHIAVGLYDAATGERLPLHTGDEALAFGQVTIQDRHGPVPNALRQNLGNVIELTGYDLERRSLQAGETLRLELYWQALRPISENYAVYARVRDAQGVEWVKQDAWPQQGAMPTAIWPVGMLITDTHDLDLPPDIPPGTYDVLVGMYASDTLRNLTLVTSDGRLLGDEMMALGRIRVREP